MTTRAPLPLARATVSSVLPLSTTTRSSQKARASRHAPMFAASFLTMMIALNRGMSDLGDGRRSRLRVGLAVLASGAPHDGSRRVAGQQFDQNHFPTLGLDLFAAHHLVRAVIAALDQHLRSQPLDQFERRVLFKHHHKID